jgi:hypothetical protein
MDIKVKVPLARTLHEICETMGARMSETELIPVLDWILKDPRE